MWTWAQHEQQMAMHHQYIQSNTFWFAVLLFCSYLCLPLAERKPLIDTNKLELNHADERQHALLSTLPLVRTASVCGASSLDWRCKAGIACHAVEPQDAHGDMRAGCLRKCAHSMDNKWPRTPNLQSRIFLVWLWSWPVSVYASSKQETLHQQERSYTKS